MAVDTSWVNDAALDAVAMIESGGKHFDEEGNLTKSPKGALGAYQWTRESAKDPGFGVEGFDPETITEEGMREKSREYLIGMQEYFPNWTKNEILQAYNWGPGNMEKFKVGKYKTLPKETRDYVVKFDKAILPKAEETKESNVESTIQATSIKEGDTNTIPTKDFMAEAFAGLRDETEIPVGTKENEVSFGAFFALIKNVINLQQPDWETWPKEEQIKTFKDVYERVTKQEKVNLPEYMTVEGVRVGFNRGGEVPPIQYYARGTDTVPAMLTPGEAVIPMEAAQHPSFKPMINQMITAGRAMQDNNVMPIAGYNTGTAGASLEDAISKALEDSLRNNPNINATLPSNPYVTQGTTARTGYESGQDFERQYSGTPWALQDVKGMSGGKEFTAKRFGPSVPPMQSNLYDKKDWVVPEMEVKSEQSRFKFPKIENFEEYLFGNDVVSKDSSPVTSTDEWLDPVTNRKYVKERGIWFDAESGEPISPAAGGVIAGPDMNLPNNAYYRLQTHLNKDKNLKNLQEAEEKFSAQVSISDSEANELNTLRELADMDSAIENSSKAEMDRRISTNLANVNKLVTQINDKRISSGLPALNDSQVKQLVEESKDGRLGDYDNAAGPDFLLDQFQPKVQPYNIPSIDLTVNDGIIEASDALGNTAKLDEEGKAIVNTSFEPFESERGTPPPLGAGGSNNNKQQKSGSFDMTGLFTNFLDLFGFTKQDAMRALLYYVGGRMTGGSHNGSLRWAGMQVLEDVDNRKTLEATTLKTQSTAFSNAVTDFRKVEEIFNDEYRNAINKAIGEKNFAEVDRLLKEAWTAKEGGGYVGVSDIAQYADITKTKQSIRLKTGGTEIKAFPSYNDPNMFYYMINGQVAEANIGPGGSFVTTSTDTLENLKGAAGDWYNDLSDTNKETLKTAFNNGGVEMDQSVYQSTMSAFADKYGQSREYIGEVLGKAVLTAAASDLIPKDMTLTGFLEWTMYEGGQRPQIPKLVFKNSDSSGKGSLVEEQVSKLREDIPNISEVISATDAELASEVGPGGVSKEPIIIPSDINPKVKIKETFNKIKNFILNSPTYKDLEAESKNKINSAMNNLNPYIALLYLNRIRMDNYNKENQEN